jgi:hypothetical protein
MYRKLIKSVVTGFDIPHSRLLYGTMSRTLGLTACLLRTVWNNYSSSENAILMQALAGSQSSGIITVIQ